MAFFVQLGGCSTSLQAHSPAQFHGLNMQRDNTTGIPHQFNGCARIVCPALLLPPIMPLQLNRHAASAATSNVSELGEISNSDSNDPQAGALVQNLNSGNIGTIHGSLFSNNQLNQIHHHHHHHPQADDDADVRVFSLWYPLDWVDPQFPVGRIRKYTGRLFQQPHGSMMIHKYEGLAIRDWKSHFDVLSAVRSILNITHNIPTSSSYMVFVVQAILPLWYFTMHSELSFWNTIFHYLGLHSSPTSLKGIKSAAKALQGYGLEPQLVVATFGPKWGLFTATFPSLPSTSDRKALAIASTFKHQSLTRSRQDGKEMLIELKYVSDMLWCTIPISQLQDMPVSEEMHIEVQTQKSSGRSSPPLFHVLASQIHHIIRELSIDVSELLTVMPHSDMTPFISGMILNIQIARITGGQPIRKVKFLYQLQWWRIYPILWDIHKACGFDPESTEMAEYLGYPLLEPRKSVSPRFGRSQDTDHPLFSGYVSEAELDNGSSSSHETFVSALLED
ncbi:hypothetical protein C8J56DRAFT_904005 [Mycena floridula]|nr:hypothetical protein C8J56DRAFT_904005 [Mycena floridula]